ncbi:thioesterase domain-containing protein [Clostridiaceae bacterium M8S5]|nr:thioesterase domain-containing protein [Clostridiaceae bacterium M8S5]
MKLFFLPYAGASAISYSVLKKYIDNEIEIHFVELAGRGSRKNEPFYTDVYQAVEDIISIIKNEINQPYAIFGHSMGGLLTYELICKMRELNLREPDHVFISARRAPHLKRPDGKVFHKMSQKEFLAELSDVGGLDEQFFKEPQLIDFFLPVIRADYKIIEEYKCKREGEKINSDMTVLYALEDTEVSKEEILEWKSYAGEEINFFEFEGGHFFIFKQTEIISNIINNTIN